MKKQPEYQKVISYVKEELLAGRLKTEQRLPAERELSAKLGVGRYSVREGLRVLENWGLIQSRPGSGSYLTGDPCRAMPSALHFLLLSRQLTQAEISQVRLALEQEAGRLAMNRITAADQQALADLLIQMQTQPEQAAQADFAFHQKIFDYAANPLLSQLMEALSLVCQEQMELLWKTAGESDRQRLCSAHQEILAAFAAKDLSRCRQAIDQHYDIMS